MGPGVCQIQQKGCDVSLYCGGMGKTFTMKISGYNQAQFDEAAGSITGTIRNDGTVVMSHGHNCVPAGGGSEKPYCSWSLCAEGYSNRHEDSNTLAGGCHDSEAACEGVCSAYAPGKWCTDGTGDSVGCVDAVQMLSTVDQACPSRLPLETIATEKKKDVAFAVSETEVGDKCPDTYSVAATPSLCRAAAAGLGHNDPKEMAASGSPACTLLNGAMAYTNTMPAESGGDDDDGGCVYDLKEGEHGSGPASYNRDDYECRPVDHEGGYVVHPLGDSKKKGDIFVRPYQFNSAAAVSRSIQFNPAAAAAP